MANTALSVLAALLVGLAPSVQTPPAATGATGADSLVGLWVAQTNPPPAPRGELTLTRGGSTWRATLGNAQASFPRDGNQVRFAFADDVGGFRGTLEKGVITGFWIQPPGGFGYSFASPLVLKPAGGNAWRGSVVPLEEGFTLYLKIFREPSGRILAAFRNPERGEIGGTTQHHVVREGDSDTVEFNAGPDPANPVIRHVGTVLRSPDRIRIPWRDPERTLELSRATPAQAAAFFPRPPRAPPYVYAKPPALADGWPTARARDVGMDEAVGMVVASEMHG